MERSKFYKERLHTLSEKLECPIEQLFVMANAPDYFYRSFTIPKKKGGVRDISAPSITLLNVQRQVKNNFLKDEFIEPQATAYRPNISIVDNARVHHLSEYLLKVDIEDFFGSIKFGRVRKLFESIVDDPHIALLLTQLTTLDRVLPQGAATSPSISNMVARNLDIRLASLSKKLGWRYTRYSDDITFSNKVRFTQRNLQEVTEIISSEGFKLKVEKTIFVSSPKKVVTGILVGGTQLNIPKTYRRELKANVYKLYRGIRATGLVSIEDPVIFERLRGKLNFWKQVSPENPQLKKIELQLEEAYSLFMDLLTS